MKSKEKDSDDSSLHLTFVEFLFSLAVAEVAMRFATVSESNVDYWSWGFASLFVHLMMSLVLIAASYIGWSRSAYSHRGTKFASVFSWDFVELLLDVTLVIVYFILVHRSEAPAQSNGTEIVPITASLRPEAFCVSLVFWLYFAWDVVSKLPCRIDKETKTRTGWGKLLRRGWVSLTVALTFMILAWKLYPVIASPFQVIAFDCSIVGFVVLFRELKKEMTLCDKYPRSRKATKITRRPLVLLSVSLALIPLLAFMDFVAIYDWLTAEEVPELVAIMKSMPDF